jgi:hypothetical protein
MQLWAYDETIDADLTSELRRKELEDPRWAESRGISIVHFALDTASRHSGQYMMISTPRGKDSRSIVELYEENQNREIFEQYKEQMLVSDTCLTKFGIILRRSH